MSIFQGRRKWQGEDHNWLQQHSRPEEVATAIIWLLSQVTSYTTGAVLDVTGGLRSR